MAGGLEVVSMAVKLAVTLLMFQQIIFPCHRQPELLRGFKKDPFFFFLSAQTITKVSAGS